MPTIHTPAIDQLAAESTVFFDMKHGHVGANLEDGFASGLLLQLSDALRDALPRLTAGGALALWSVWAYKYVTGPHGVRPHADEGELSINCWLTPDGDNLGNGTAHGGLRLFHRDQPDGLDFATANRDFRRVREILGDERPVEVEYAANRCVVFRSSLFHETVPFAFREGLLSYRTNLVFMYGSRR